MKKTLILLSFFAVMLSLSAASYKIRYLTADDGLSRNFVTDIFRDSKGFIWIGTSRGLDRYDGYTLWQYNSNRHDHPLSNEVVRCIEEDARGNLWIGTENGLFFMDYRTGIVQTVQSRLGLNKPYLSGDIIFIRRDEYDKLWLGHTQGLSLLTANTSGDYNIEEIYETENISDILIFNGNILVADGSDVFRLLKDNNNRYTRLSGDPKLRNLPGVVNVLYHDQQTIWVGTSLGLVRYDLNSERIQLYQTNPYDPTSLSSNTVTDINKTADGQLLVGTLIGLNLFDHQNNRFSRITSGINPGVVSLNNNFISCIYVDHNMIWIGTEKGGVNILFPDQQFFTNVSHVPDDFNSLSKNPVNAIYEDEEGDLWVGTVEGGLNLKKRGTDEFLHFVSDINNPRSISHNSVSSICQDYEGNYWFGTWGLGLNFLDKKNKGKPVFERFVNLPGRIGDLISNFVAAVVPDSLNIGIWVGTREGLVFLDIATRQFYPVLSNLPSAVALRFVTGMTVDRQNRLWCGTGNGLFMLDLRRSDPRNDKIAFKHFHYELSNPESRKIEKINCILQTKDGSMWFGSNGNGIYLMDGTPDQGRFKKIDESMGLIDNVVYGMLEDEAGTIWLSTDKGLCAFDPNRNHFRSFTIVDGLASNQFYWDAYHKGRDGKMYFGHVAGYTVFDPLKYIPPVARNKVAITRIAVLNEDIYPAQKKNAADYMRFTGSDLVGLVLKESDKIFSVEFSALSFYLPDKIRYAYRLRGFENEWKEVTSDRRFANFTNIKHGRYDFEVRCTNADGTWSDIVTALAIRVVPPFWKSWWFILLVLSLSLYMLYYGINHRIKSLKKQEIHLKQLVEERTREIEEQKEKVQEATLDKIAFFTNITHEFRTPVTLILGPVERALKLSTNPKVLEQLNIVRRNSKLLLSLINQLMDFRKVDSGKMELARTKGNFINFMDEIILPFEDMGKDRGIEFKKQYRISPPDFLFDRDSLQKLIANLLSNALKFTPDNGIITIVASTYTDKSDQKEKLYMAVKDSGNGIPEEELELIFDRFYQSKNHKPYAGSGQSGTGIGLYLCKKIVELHEGKIDAVNVVSGGASFRFIIPIERGNTDIVPDPESLELQTDEAVSMHDTHIEESSRHKPLLLIVEDNADMRKYVKSLLIDDYQVIEAPNGLVGLNMTRRYIPDLIISDIMMPEMDGVEFCKELKDGFNTSHIPVIMLTAKSSVDTQIEALQIGADAFLVKPFDEQLLRAVIDNLTDKRKKIQQSFASNMDVSVMEFSEDSQDKKFIDKALQVVKDNYTNPDFDVAEFIDAMGISRSLLHKKLTNLTGQSASRFVRTYRLNTARELIIRNRVSHAMNISEIAYQVGFNDPKYFTRCFTKQFGVQPSTLLDEEQDDVI